jgi:hypothetical protein
MPPKKTKSEITDEDEIDIKKLLDLDTPVKKKTKRELSEEQKDMLRERLIGMRETAKQKREDKKKRIEDENSNSSENVVIKKANDIEDIFEKKYRDKFEMISEKLSTINLDISEIKRLKLEKISKRKEEADQKKAEEEQKKQKDLEKAPAAAPAPAQEKELVSILKPSHQAQDTAIAPMIKMSFRDKYKKH